MSNLKKIYLVYTKCNFSGSELNVPVICLAYPYHNLFLYCRMQPANKIQPVIELQFDFCIPVLRVHPAQQDLFATGAPAGSFARPHSAGSLSWGPASPAAARPGGNRGSLRRSLRGLVSDTATKFEGAWRRLSTRSLHAQHVLAVRRQQVMQGLKNSGYATVVGGIISFVALFEGLLECHA